MKESMSENIKNTKMILVLKQTWRSGNELLRKVVFALIRIFKKKGYEINVGAKEGTEMKITCPTDFWILAVANHGRNIDKWCSFL